MEVNLRRQKSGFGFRVLGGDEAGQPVSPETRERVCMATGVEPYHHIFILSKHQTTHTLRTRMTFDTPHPSPEAELLSLAALLLSNTGASSS